MATFSQDQQNRINMTLEAFKLNFGYPVIERGTSGTFYVYSTEAERDNNRHTEYCPSFDYLMGWMQGAIKANNGIMKPMRDNPPQQYRPAYRRLWDGREYAKIYGTNDRNGNKVVKVFFPDGKTEIIKDARAPISTDKWYKTMSGLRYSK